MNRTIRILIVEDNAADAELAEYTLKSAGFTLLSKIVETRDEFVHALSDFSPDIILSDYDLPLFNGSDALDIVKEIRPEIPFILFTGAMGEERAIEILTGGATDYVMKNRLSRLVPAVERALKEAGEHRRRKEAEAERDLLIKELEVRIQERTAELQAEKEKLNTYHNELEMRVKKIATILDSITDSYFELDSEWRFAEINENALLNFGRKREEVIGHTYWDVLPQTRGSIYEDQYTKAMSGAEIHFEVPSIALSPVKWFEIHACPSRGGISVYFRDITERKRAEEELRESEERFRVAQELSLDAFTILKAVRDESGGIVDFLWTYVNPEAGRILLHSPEYLVGKRLLEVLPGNRANSGLFESYVRVVETGEAHELELHYESEGIRGWFRNMAIKLDDGVAVSFGDITGRKQAEQALRKSESLYRSIARNFPNGAIYVFDRDLRFLVVDGTALDKIGWSKERLEGANVHDLDEETRSIIEPRYRQVLAGESLRFETDYRGRTILSDYVPIRGDSGEVELGMVIAVDITDRKQAERELKHQRELLQQIIDSIPVLLVLWDPRLKIFTLNRHAQSVLGWTGSDANEGGFMSKVYPDKEYRAKVAGYMKSLNPGWHEWIATSKDGSRIPIDWSNVYLSDKTMIGIGIDIRERKRAEEALRKAKDELEDRVRERTALYAETNKHLKEEIVERQRAEQSLLRAQNKLREITSEIIITEEKARQGLATNLHDTVVQTLGAAKLRSQLIQDEIPDTAKPIFSELQNLISESVTQARSIMAEMSPPVLNELGLIPALEWLVEKYSQNGLKVSFKSNTVSLSLNREVQILLFQAARELLTNIVKHAHADSATVKFCDNGKIFKVEVKDNGSGFDSKKTFQPGATGGFGLYSIRERLRHIGGVLAIKSRPGRGTTVLITAPREIDTNTPD